MMINDRLSNSGPKIYWLEIQREFGDNESLTFVDEKSLLAYIEDWLVFSARDIGREDRRIRVLSLCSIGNLSDAASAYYNETGVNALWGTGRLYSYSRTAIREMRDSIADERSLDDDADQ